jgi:hypothetical protein
VNCLQRVPIPEAGSRFATYRPMICAVDLAGAYADMISAALPFEDVTLAQLARASWTRFAHGELSIPRRRELARI